MKAPVPPAQFPFMRMSGMRPLSKKIILLSSPPMSMNVRVCGKDSLTSVAAEMTSCTKGKPQSSA